MPERSAVDWRSWGVAASMFAGIGGIAALCEGLGRTSGDWLAIMSGPITWVYAASHLALDRGPRWRWLVIPVFLASLLHVLWCLPATNAVQSVVTMSWARSAQAPCLVTGIGYAVIYGIGCRSPGPVAIMGIATAGSMLLARIGGIGMGVIVLPLHAGVLGILASENQRAWSRMPKPGACAGCGYDMAGLGAGMKCPECGAG
ncbi:MAG: hypothetical protein IT435_18725 [Phycisphaerales bacterium]|nr:hypothetical protein [Phycisphaerales bacterium]